MQPAYQGPSEVAPGIYLVPIPVPIPLKYVNCYLCRGPSGWTVVDTGFNDPLAQAAWPMALAEIGVRWQEIDRILVTHYHPDHFGAAGWMQERTGAPVFMHERESDLVRVFWEEEPAFQAEALRGLFTAHGMSDEMGRALGEHHEMQRRLVLPLPAVTAFPTGSLLRIGEREYQVLWMPGHTDGLAVFWDAGTGILLANDMILAKITPNVSIWPRCRPNPLEDYLSSLGRLEALGARLALPGHRTVIDDVAGRAREIRRHHADRLNQMERLCGGLRGATAWEVCEQVFAPETLTLHQIRFAMAETLAHLVYMEKQGRLLTKGGRFVQA